mgnify:CR=1 FL=1
MTHGVSVVLVSCVGGRVHHAGWCRYPWQQVVAVMSVFAGVVMSTLAATPDPDHIQAPHVRTLLYIYI